MLIPFFTCLFCFIFFFFFFQAEDGIRDADVTGVQTCALPILEQQFGTLQCHGTGAFWEPLIPTNTYTNFCITGLPNFKTGIAWVEIILFMIARAIWNMAFTVDPEHTAIGINDGNTVEARLASTLKEANRQNHF